MGIRTSSSGGMAYLVTLSWDGGGPVRLTSWPQSLDLGSGEVFAATAMLIRYGEEDGTSDDAPLTIDVPDDVYPLSILGQNIAFAKLWCSIEEYLVGDADSREETWYGQVANVRVNPSNIRGILRARIDGILSMVNVPLSVSADTDCGHVRFGDLGCGFDVSTVTYDATVTAVNPDSSSRRVTLSFTGATPDLSDENWRGGFVKVEGAVAQIRRSLEDGDFDLVQRPNSTWVDKACTAQEGCDRTDERCDALGNKSRRLALGKGIPDHNPTLTNKG